ncbi:MAG TPA: PAS domain-containing sensor histidine kinase [Candidatus Methanoperedens sp.]|nr:PAS domain-containing sensor histidine kinase [Candidatus Methanoperedens sp.]
MHQIELELQNEELHRAQEELEASRARYFDLYDLAPVGYCTLSQQGLILEANLTATTMLGVARNALLRQPFGRFILPEDREIYLRCHNKLFATGEPQGCELRLLRAPASRFWARIEATMTRDAGSGAPLWRAVLIDIGALKRVEEALRDHERELAEKNAVLERFTTAVSHDLKSPLATISTFLDLLELDIRRHDSKEAEKCLTAIRKALNKMLHLLGELISLLRVGHKTNPVVEAPLQEVVKEALDLVAGSVATRNVEVVVAGEPVVLHGDRPRLVEVFQNLVDNAVKFMGDQKAPRVEIGVEHAGGETVIFVRDNGVGIDPKDQAKIFDLFEKLDPALPGTGLGLALVKRIVEVHGGRIWVESQGAGKGTGATFRFTLAK